MGLLVPKSLWQKVIVTHHFHLHAMCGRKERHEPLNGRHDRSMLSHIVVVTIERIKRIVSLPKIENLRINILHERHHIKLTAAQAKICGDP